MVGDGMHAAFADPLAAVVAAVEIQRALAEPGATGACRSGSAAEFTWVRSSAGIRITTVPRSIARPGS